MNRKRMNMSKPGPDIFHIIQSRTSVRSYRKKAVSPALAGEIRAYLEAASGDLLFGSAVRFGWVPAAAGDPEALKRAGTYGVIRNPAAFVTGMVRPGPMALVDLGYAMEKVVLYLTRIGLGTCWMGAFFKKGRFAEKTAAAPDEEIPAILCLGYPAPKRNRVDRFIRRHAGSDHRLPRESLFFYGDFNTPQAVSGKKGFGEILDMVRLAPSASNRQPWRVLQAAESDDFHFYLYRDPAYARKLRAVGAADLQQVDMGIAICHFDVTARACGRKGGWKRLDSGFPEPPGSMEYTATWQGIS